MYAGRGLPGPTVKQLKSLIVHDDVSFIEIRRGEGIEGGDTLVIGVEHGEETSSTHDTAYYFLPPTALRLNRYRFRYPIVDIELYIDEDFARELKTSIEELRELVKQEKRIALPLVRGRRPRLVVEALYVEKGVKLVIRLSAPQGGYKP